MFEQLIVRLTGLTFARTLFEQFCIVRTMDILIFSLNETKKFMGCPNNVFVITECVKIIVVRVTVVFITYKWTE